MLALLLLQSSSSDAASEAAASALCGGFGLLYAVCWGVIALVGIALIVFWLLMLIDCFQRDESEFPNSTGNTKTIWLVVLLASWLLSLNWLAAIIYYFMVKRNNPRGKAQATTPPAPPEAPAS